MLSGCAALQSSLSNVYNLANCDYKYHSISSLSVSGMNLSNGLSPLMIPKMIAVFSGNASSIPLNFTLNLNVKNPNAGTAAFQALHYIISIDGVQFTAGHFDQTFSVEAGETKVLPITIGVDVAELMRSHSKSAIENIVKNFIGINGAPSKVSIQLKPSFKVGDQLFTSPVYIPVNFNFGGKKNMSATRP
jgi:LEA14-like dessication related protein